MRKTAALLPLLLLLSSLALPSGQAQELPHPEDEDVYKLQLLSDKGAAFVPFLGNDLVNLTVEALSSTRVGANPTLPGKVLLEAHVVGNPSGWLASVGSTSFMLMPGTTKNVVLNVQVGATVQDPRVEVLVEAVYVSPSGQRNPTNITLMAIAQPNPVVNLQLGGSLIEFQPDQQKRIPVEVRNFDYYPEMISFEVQAPEGWVVSPPSSIQLGPRESTTIYIDVKAPQDPWFRLYPSTDILTFTARTETNEGGRYTVGVPTPISGSFLPGWVLPHIVLLGLGLIAAVRVQHQRRRDRRAEKGKPTSVIVEPEREAQLAVLKKTEPGKAERLEAKLKERHSKRKEAWKEHYQRRKELEKALQEREKRRHDAVIAKRSEQEKDARRQARRERKQQRKAQRAKKKRLKKLRKQRRKAEKRAEKQRKKEEKRLRKQLKREEKEREKKREKLEKKRAKLAKRKRKQKEKTLKAKRKKLEKLQKQREKAEGDDEPFWKFWG